MHVPVKLDNLSFKYRTSPIENLRNINCEVKEGEFIIIMGHGGAGKSTLCFTINGLVPRFLHGTLKGAVFIYGKKTTNISIKEMAEFVGLVFQDFESQLFCSNVELEMAFGLENLNLNKAVIEKRIKSYIDFVGLKEKLKSDISSLSGGQKQRLAIGAVLAMEPKIIIMDEPTTDLDPIGKNHIFSISDTLKEKKRTMIMVEADPEMAYKADIIWLMKGGELIKSGPPKEILQDIDTLKSCGIMVPPVIEFFKKMGWDEIPLHVDEAIEFIKERHPEIVNREKKDTTKRSTIKGNSIIETRDLCYRYPFSKYDVLKNINLTIKEGEFVAILGQNGSGKTTLAKHFNRLLKPTSGEVLVKGKRTTDYKQHELAKIVGYVFQNPDNQIFAGTVWEEVAFGLKMLGEDAKVIKQNVEEALYITGLTGYENNSPFLLTKGERQRVAVASILSVKPEIIVLDEPTTGLDYDHQLSTMNMLKELNNQGRTIIIITHSMWIAEQFASRVIVIKDGVIIADDYTRDVFFKEDLLKEAFLMPSQIVRLSNWLGTQSMTVDGLISELKNEPLSISR